MVWQTIQGRPVGQGCQAWASMTAWSLASVAARPELTARKMPSRVGPALGGADGFALGARDLGSGKGVRGGHARGARSAGPRYRRLRSGDGVLLCSWTGLDIPTRATGAACRVRWDAGAGSLPRAGSR